MARAPRRDAAARGAPGAARKHRGLIGLGLGALACFAIATLPASLYSGAFAGHGLSSAAFSGTIWSGGAAGLAWQGTALGDLRWNIRPLSLLRGRVAADLSLARVDGSASATLEAGFGSTVEFRQVRVDLPLEFLAQLPLGMARGWQAQARGTFDELRLESGWPASIRGTLDVDGLVVPRLGPAPVGSFKAVAPDPRVAQADASGVTVRVTDTDGLLSVDAALTLGSGRSFRFDGTVAPRAAAPPDLVRALEVLGPADAAGRRSIGASGTL